MRARLLSASLIDTMTITALKCDHNAFVHIKTHQKCAISKNAFAVHSRNYDCGQVPATDSGTGLATGLEKATGERTMAKKAAAKKPAAKPAAKKAAAKKKK